MKTLIILVVLATLAIASPTDDQIFEDYLQTFNVRLGRSSIEKAKENVLKHHQEVQQHNEKFQKGEETFEAGLNEFSWKSDEQFSKENLGSLDEPNFNDTDAAKLPELRSGRALPDYFNWVDRGVVRPVQNQGNCGSCYAFASIGAIESVACIKKGQCAKLSEQEAMECTNGCNGGSYGNVYGYSCSKGGCTSSSYSYTPYTRSSCSSSRSRVSNTKTCSWYRLNGYGAETIRQYLYSQGPMYISFMVYQNFYSYSSGIYSSTSGSGLGGHAVLLVGWGTQNGVPYWILKNSWGTGWGERGFFRMRRGIDLATIESRSIAVPIIA